MGSCDSNLGASTSFPEFGDRSGDFLSSSTASGRFLFIKRGQGGRNLQLTPASHPMSNPRIPLFLLCGMGVV